MKLFIIVPLKNVTRGYIGFSLSVCLSICLSRLPCPHNITMDTLMISLKLETDDFHPYVAVHGDYCFISTLMTTLKLKTSSWASFLGKWSFSHLYLHLPIPFTVPSLQPNISHVPVFLYFFLVMHCSHTFISRSYLSDPYSASPVSHSSNLHPLLLSPSLLVPVIFPSTLHYIISWPYLSFLSLCLTFV